MTTRPNGWTSITEDRERGGLIYFYADGSTFYLNKEDLHSSIYPTEEPTIGTSGPATGDTSQTPVAAEQPTA